jgi:hypothetical protein
MGQPEKYGKEQFTAIQVRGVTIWLSTNIKADKSTDGIQIRLSKFFIFKRLSIDGASIESTCKE